MGQRRHQICYRQSHRQRKDQKYDTQRMHDVSDQRTEHLVSSVRPWRHMLRLLDRDHEERQHRVPLLQRRKLMLPQAITRVLKINIHKNYQGIYKVIDSFKVQILDNSEDSNQSEDRDTPEQSIQLG